MEPFADNHCANESAPAAVDITVMLSISTEMTEVDM
jgi:hypothetical protein